MSVCARECVCTCVIACCSPSLVASRCAFVFFLMHYFSPLKEPGKNRKRNRSNFVEGQTGGLLWNKQLVKAKVAAISISNGEVDFTFPNYKGVYLNSHLILKFKEAKKVWQGDMHED